MKCELCRKEVDYSYFVRYPDDNLEACYEIYEVCHLCYIKYKKEV